MCAAMVRDVSAGLWSNAASTPIVAEQDRGFRELYLKAPSSAHAGAHEWKAGGDLTVGHVRERFGYRITDPDGSTRTPPPSSGSTKAAPTASRRSSSRIKSVTDRGR